MMDKNNLGSFNSLQELWEAHPEGGHEGDYATVNGVVFRWNKYNRIWSGTGTPMETYGRKTDLHEGDVVINNDLTVGGIIRARGVKQPNKGLFHDLASLQKRYPFPEVGWWATVGDSVPGQIYRCDQTGVWSATGETGGLDSVDYEKITKIEQLLQEGYTFMGVATPETNPGTPDRKVFYIATTPGLYVNFNSVYVNNGALSVLKYDTNWDKEDISNDRFGGYIQKIRTAEPIRNGSPGNPNNPNAVAPTYIISVNEGDKISNIWTNRPNANGYAYCWDLVTYDISSGISVNTGHYLRQLYNQTDPILTIENGEFGFAFAMYEYRISGGTSDKRPLRISDFNGYSINVIFDSGKLVEIEAGFKGLAKQEDLIKVESDFVNYLFVSDFNLVSGGEIKTPLIPVSKGQTILFYGSSYYSTEVYGLYDINKNKIGQQTPTGQTYFLYSIVVDDNIKYIQFTQQNFFFPFVEIVPTTKSEQIYNLQDKLKTNFVGFLANGSIGNPGNANAVCTRYIIDVSDCGQIRITTNRPNTSGCEYRFGFIIYNVNRGLNLYWNGHSGKIREDITAKAVNNIIDINDNEKGLCVEIYEYRKSDNTVVPLRVEDFDGYAINIARIPKEEYDKIPYTRNAEREIALVNACRYRANSGTSKDFQSLVITDIHGDGQAVKNAISMVNNFDTIDAFICCGDIVPSNYTNTFKTDYINMLSALKRPFFNVIGNHDVGNSKTISLCATHQQAYDTFIKPMVTAGVLISGEYENGKPYYYHDITSKSIRMICLYEYDDALDTENDTTYKVRRGDRVIRQEQAQWFLDTLCSTPANYSVVVLLHNPFSDNSITQPDLKFCKDVTASGVSCSQNNMQTDFIAEAVNAFISGSIYTPKVVMKGDAAYMNVLNDGEINYAYQVSKDFSTKNIGVKFMCYLFGHIHYDAIFRHKVYNQLGMASLCATTDWANSESSDIRRNNKDSISYDSLNVVSFDCLNNKVRLVKLGANVTDNMVARDYEMISLDS